MSQKNEDHNNLDSIDWWRPEIWRGLNVRPPRPLPDHRGVLWVMYLAILGFLVLVFIKASIWQLIIYAVMVVSLGFFVRAKTNAKINRYRAESLKSGAGAQSEG